MKQLGTEKKETINSNFNTTRRKDYSSINLTVRRNSYGNLSTKDTSHKSTHLNLE